MFNNTIVCKNLFCLFILLLLISSLISPSEKNISIIDRNFDGKTEQTSKLIHKKFSVRSALDTNMVIGMIQTGSYQVPFNRLQKLGYHNINLLSPSSGLDVLIPNEIVILPVCWLILLTELRIQ